MSFNPNIPQLTSSRSQSQRQLKANFSTIATAFAENHVNLNADANEGLHSYLTIQKQTGDPTTTANETALYQKLASSIPNLFFMPNNTQTPIQLTYPSIKADSSDDQYSFSAGPFVIYGGNIINPTQNQVVVLSPATTLIYVGLCAANCTQRRFFPGVYQAAATNIVANSFTLKFMGLPVQIGNIYYLAIGI